VEGGREGKGRWREGAGKGLKEMGGREEEKGLKEMGGRGGAGKGRMAVWSFTHGARKNKSHISGMNS